jgi:hypothetical protein
MAYTLAGLDDTCTYCGTELYVEELDHPEFAGRCMDCGGYIINYESNSQGGGPKTMTNFKIYDNSAPKKEVYLKLQKSGAGAQLVAVNANGLAYPGGVLLTIMNTGEIVRAGGVGKDLGFTLDSTGKIKLT